MHVNFKERNVASKKSQALGCGTRVTLVVRQREGGSQVSRGEFVGLTKQRVLLTLQCKFNSVRLLEFHPEVPRNLKERNTAVCKSGDLDNGFGVYTYITAWPFYY